MPEKPRDELFVVEHFESSQPVSFKSRSYGGSTRSYEGWDSGVSAGKKAKIKAPKRIK